MLWNYLLIAGASYLAGSIQFGLIVGRRARGVDIRDFGSGKTGFTNSLRTLGPGLSFLVLAGDFLKGALPVLVVAVLLHNPGLEVMAATAAVLGHVWPVFAGFKGGRGVSTAFGATMAMMPPVGLILLVISIALVVLYRYMSLTSLVGTPTGAVLVWALVLGGHEPRVYGIWALIAATIILTSHRENLRRLRNGTEPKIGQGGQRRTSPGNASP
jgi:acyl phosphate:glycerol-3-phosphate acyltransferase